MLSRNLGDKMNFDECMNYIGSYSRLGKKVTDLSRAAELMERVGNPQNDLKFVHIAGTNGKGSTLEYIANALIISGYKTGEFTSPYVTHFTDRIRINSAEIDEKSLGEICEFVRERVAEREYSQFEITMAIAMLWYKREKCDVVVLEAGIGGLLDSTNVIPSPLLSVITSVSLDHTSILGNTVEEIAVQKAGIIKKKSITVLSMDNKKSVTNIIRRTAGKKGSFFVQPLSCNLKYLSSDSDGVRFIYKKKEYKTAMAGSFQMYNAVTAIESCWYLRTVWGFKISDENIKKSISNARVKARAQYIDGNPPVIVDGGHNPSGITAFSQLILSERYQGRKIYTVMGMSGTKDYHQCVIQITAVSDMIFFVDDFTENCVSAQILADIAGKYIPAEICTLTEALEKSKRLARENNGIVVVCGSLYLASSYLNKNIGNNITNN